MRYYGSVYRPPSEAHSLIVQVTYGCSHSTCAFCSMYREKHFSIRPLSQVLEDFTMARAAYSQVERIFLADGDALMRRADELLRILTEIRRLFPECQRVTCYASPGSIQHKTPEELQALRAANLAMVYMGLESGSARILEIMDKGHTPEAIIAAGQKVRQAGIALSVTAISGLGGQALWRQHAADTAAALSAINPEYIGLLTLMVEPGTPLHDWVHGGSFPLLDSAGVLEETRLLVEGLDSPGSVFRMNHASNYLILRGTLNQDKPALLARIRAAQEGQANLRPERFRAL